MEVFSNSPRVAKAAAGDSLHGLTFGRKIYFEDGGGSNSKETPAPAPPAVATAPPAKRGKGTVHGGQQPPRCQVEGCEADLTGAKTYYCRHKVCGMHSKAPKVIVAGLEQRFCQQCSRFHQLPEFDQGKRSCRRRLAGHNERRRKPPPRPFASRFARPSSSFQEEPGRLRSFLVDFSYPRISSATRDVWPTVQPVDPRATNQYLGILYPPCNAAVVHGVHPCMHGLPEWPVYSLPEHSPSNCLAGVADSSCALSLLSTQPWNNSTRNRVSASINGTLTAQSIITTNCMPNSLSCITQGGKTSSQNNIEHDMGLAGAAEVGEGQLSSELELALQGNGPCTDCSTRAAAYHESEHAMHWSL